MMGSRPATLAPASQLPISRAGLSKFEKDYYERLRGDLADAMEGKIPEALRDTGTMIFIDFMSDWGLSKAWVSSWGSGLGAPNGQIHGLVRDAIGSAQAAIHALADKVMSGGDMIDYYDSALT